MEFFAMAGAHQGKITTIGRQDALKFKTLRHGYNCCINKPDLRVFVPAHQL